MNQYFVKYSLNGRPKLQQFTCSVDVKSNKTAALSTSLILLEICKIHNLNFINEIHTEDVVIEVLTRLN